MNFGAKVKVERQRRGLTKRGLSEAAGLTQSHAGQLEGGVLAATTSGAEQLASALGLEISDLLLSGPAMFEVEFDIGAEGMPPSPDLERMALAAVPSEMLPSRASVWPWVGDGCLRFRVRASGLPAIVGLSGSKVAGITESLPRPKVWAVEASSELAVLVRAPGTISAKRAVLTELSPHDYCPKIDIQRRGRRLWIARMSAVPARCSLALQRLAPGSPVGMFVPA